ncbi:MAG: hypothetical protein IAG13_25020 [Deltaproteobacteria bacterium]|nr:hypothetical protein [Nannocystaceae bacterium]
MRTSADLPGQLLAEARRLAAARGVSVRRLLEDSLREYFMEEQRGSKLDDPVAMLPLVREVELVEGVELDDTSAILDLR